MVGEELLHVKDPGDERMLSLLVFGKIVASKEIKFATEKASLLAVWSLRKGVSIRSMGSNLMAF